MRVRETRHGPVIDDFIRRADDLTPQGHVLALQATALDGNDTSAEGFGRFGLAQNWEDFLNAARKIVSPMQNMVYADTAGNVGLVSPARVPIRRKGDGSMPVPGWTSDFDWAGFVPFDELPRVYNPPSGIIVNANGRLVPDDYRHFITRDWAEPYRQLRANQLLREVERHPVYGMIVMQADNLTRRRRRHAAAAAEGRAAQRPRRPGPRADGPLEPLHAGEPRRAADLHRLDLAAAARPAGRRAGRRSLRDDGQCPTCR